MSIYTAPLSLAVAGATYIAPLAITTTILSEHSLIPVGAAIACCVLLSGVIWKAASQLQRITDRLDQLERDVSDIRRRCYSQPRCDHPRE